MNKLLSNKYNNFLTRLAKYYLFNTQDFEMKMILKYKEAYNEILNTYFKHKEICVFQQGFDKINVAEYNGSMKNKDIIEKIQELFEYKMAMENL